jgi:N-acetylmuramoyl-L-alanine amidase
MSFSPARRSSSQRVLAWGGLLLMAICVAWLQIVPGPEKLAVTDRPGSPQKRSVGLVIIDAGHGGQDSGTMHNGVLEKDLTLDVARRVEGFARVHGFRTMLTRPSDIWVSLAARADTANRENDCVFVSIHFDEGGRAGATGVQTFYATRQRPKSKIPSWLAFLQPGLSQSGNFESQSLAGFVQEALVARTHAVDRGTRAEQFFVVAHVRHPAVLVEGGFLSNNGDIAKLATEDYRQELAAAITEGIVRYRDTLTEREPK